MELDVDAVRDDLQAAVVEHFGDADAVLVLDEGGFLDEGRESAGVARQGSGMTGRIENSQIGNVLDCERRHGRLSLDRALYLPKDRAEDPPQRAEGCSPGDVDFATKSMPGLAMLERARAAGVPFAWIHRRQRIGGV